MVEIRNLLKILARELMMFSRCSFKDFLVKLRNLLFQALDKDLDGTLTFQEFIEASSKRSEMHRRQASVRLV